MKLPTGGGKAHMLAGSWQWLQPESLLSAKLGIQQNIY